MKKAADSMISGPPGENDCGLKDPLLPVLAEAWSKKTWLWSRKAGSCWRNIGLVALAPQPRTSQHGPRRCQPSWNGYGPWA